MYQKLLKWSGIIGISLLSLMLAGMLYYSATKTLVYVQAEEESGQMQSIHADSEPDKWIELKPEERDNQTRFLIPVADLITQDEIHIENDYMNHRITINVTGMEASFYEEEVMFGNLQGITSVQAGNRGDGVVILISLDRMYEYEAVLENQKLGITLKRPSEVYDRIVVLDAGHGGADHGIALNGIREDELVLDVAERVKKKLEAAEIRVYMTRGSTNAPDLQKRAEFAADADASLVLSLHLADGTEYGISAYYNDTYFRPDFTNVEFADALVTNTAIVVHNRGNGIFPAEEEEHGLLFGVTVPAAELFLGCPGNTAEAELLKRDDYKEDLAEGICQAILMSFEEMEP